MTSHIAQPLLASEPKVAHQLTRNLTRRARARVLMVDVEDRLRPPRPEGESDAGDGSEAHQ